MKQQQEDFASLLRQFEYHYDLRTAFEDFLTLTICAFGQNPSTGKSYDEELYLQTIAKYKGSQLRHNFPKLVAYLALEMEERMESSEGFDVLGEFYESSLYRKGASQYFTPWPICVLMARCAAEEAKGGDAKLDRPVRILDSSCGSGRVLLAASRVQGLMGEYYGVDVDPVCAKMCALNLFLSGLFRSEVICADALVSEDFRAGYRSSLLPFGLFRIEEKEKARLWYLLKDSKDVKASERRPHDSTAMRRSQGDQLTFF